jgi:hypothetical protein
MPDPSYLWKSFEDFYELHLKLLGHFPEEAGIRTGTIPIEGQQNENTRILPELPCQMMFVSEAVAQTRLTQLQGYVDVNFILTQALLKLPMKISRSPLVLSFFRD